jgi:hypothetical protein
MRIMFHLVILLLSGLASCWAAVGATTSTIPRLVAFEPNRGQFEKGADFGAISAGRLVTFKGSNVSYLLGGKNGASPARIRIGWVGALKTHSLAEKPLRGVSNYFVGRDASKWIANVPTFASLRIPGLYPGVDLHYYGSGKNWSMILRFLLGLIRIASCC